jgi:hypothetical protein
MSICILCMYVRMCWWLRFQPLRSLALLQFLRPSVVLDALLHTIVFLRLSHTIFLLLSRTIPSSLTHHLPSALTHHLPSACYVRVCVCVCMCVCVYVCECVCARACTCMHHCCVLRTAVDWRASAEKLGLYIKFGVVNCESDKNLCDARGAEHITHSHATPSLHHRNTCCRACRCQTHNVHCNTCHPIHCNTSHTPPIHAGVKGQATAAFLFPAMAHQSPLKHPTKLVLKELTNFADKKVCACACLCVSLRVCVRV